MKIPLHDIILLYQKLIEQINVAEMSVIIFTALDVDALCTLKMFSKLLKTENILYKIYPVSTYGQLQNKIQETKIYEEQIKLFVFINCGGLIDLTSKWLTRDPQTKIFLFDVNKPINHANIESENIKIVDDNQSGLDLAPTSYEMGIYQNLDEDAFEQAEEDNDSDEDIGFKRKRGKNSEINKFEKIKKYRNMINEKVNTYYGEQFFGFPSSYITYRLIKDLNKSNNEFLWCGIVGLTGMFIEQKINKENFESINDFYRSDMSKYNQQQEKGEKGSLKRKLDFQFPLLRHWSLYESINNSSYMVSKFCLWEQTGIDKLNEFLHLIGISLMEAKQLFKFMAKETVTKLQTNIFKYAENPKFNLLDIAFDSFSKQVDYCVEFMASDYYYAFTATLERSPKTKITMESVIEQRVDNFWEAYELFDAPQSVLSDRIEEYKKVITIILKQSKNIIERNHIMNGQSFSFVNIPNDTLDRKIFQHPFTLIRLAYILMYMNKEKKRWKLSRPFIASLQNNETGRSTMVGVMVDQKNSFMNKFNSVTENLEISQVRLDSFMGNIMVIPKDMMVKVIRELGEL